MADEVWTIRRMLEWCEGYLARHGDEHPRLSAQWLLCDVCDLTRVQLYLDFDRPLDAAELDRMRELVRRRSSGEPLQYVTGEMPFRHLVLRCGPGVLIPRPETEVLVDHALAALDAGRGERSRVLEVGCGTGCVALSIAGERPGVRVVATDIAPEAIALATRNRDVLHLERRVELVECDLASGVDSRLFGTFDLLVSNPPYIPSQVLDTEVPEEVVGHEPRLALDGGADGLDVFRRLLELAPRALAPGGTLAVELYEGHLDAAAELVRAAGGWARVEVHEDLTHRPRVLVAVREGELPAAEPWPGSVLPCSQYAPEAEVLDAAEAVLAADGVLVMPTDSVYGIGAVPSVHGEGHERIFALKRRDRAQTLPWLVDGPDALDRYGADVPAWARRVAAAHWPGALTLVVRAGEAVPPQYQAANGTIALRVPDSPLVRELARRAGGALAVTSANLHGEPSPTSAADLAWEITDGADLTLDAGPAPVGVASTIVDATGDEPEILREGAIPAEAIQALL